MANANQIARRVKLLDAWRDEALAEALTGIDGSKTTVKELALFDAAYRRGWSDLARLMATHGQFTDTFGS